MTKYERDILDKRMPEFHFAQWVLDKGLFVQVAIDGEEIVKSRNYDEIRAWIYNLDECYLNAEDEEDNRFGWAFFIRYNGGDENWSDWGINPFMEEFEEVRRSYEKQRDFELSYQSGIKYIRG